MVIRLLFCARHCAKCFALFNSYCREFLVRTPYFHSRVPGFGQVGSSGRESACNAGASGDRDSSPGLEDPLKEEMATHSSVLPGKFYGQRTLVGYSPWDHKESDTTE